MMPTDLSCSEADTSQQVSSPPVPADMAVLQRSRGHVKIGVGCDVHMKSRLTRLLQEGCLKVRLPRPQLSGWVDAVLINTSGGLTGGDVVSVEVKLSEGAQATVTTPGCERIYRSLGTMAVIHHSLDVGRGARLDWLPQETILFDQSRLQRRVEVQLCGDAEVTIAEAILFGRTAMGETVRSGFLRDFWTIHHDGRIVLADATRVSEPFAQTLLEPTVLRGYLGVACVVHVGKHLEAKRDALRAAFSNSEGCRAGVSMVNGALLARIVAPNGRALRNVLVRAIDGVRDRRPLPRNWQC